MGRGSTSFGNATTADVRTGTTEEVHDVVVVPERNNRDVSYEQFIADNLNIIRITETAQVEKMITHLRESGQTQLSVDFETTKRQEKFDFDYSPFDGRIRLIQIGYEHPRPTQFVIDCFTADARLLEPLATDPNIEWLIHYSTFEQAWARVHLGFEFANTYDTCAAFQSIQKELERWQNDPKRGEEKVNQVIPGWKKHGNGLAEITRRVHGFELPKDEQVSDWSVEQLSESQIEYAAMDVAVLPKVARAAKDLAEQTGITSRINWRCNKAREEVIEAIPREMIEFGDQSRELDDLIAQASSLDELSKVASEARYMSISAVNRDRAWDLFKHKKTELSRVV